MLTPSLSRLSLDKAFLGFMALGALIFFGVTVVLVNARVQHLQDDLMRSTVKIRGEHVAVYVANHLEDHWTDLENLATALPFSDPDTFRAFLTREVGPADHLVWAAFVTVEGDVAIASRGEGEARNVATEAWFLAAQRGPMIGHATDDTGHERLTLSLPVAATGSIGAGYLIFQFHPGFLAMELGEVSDSLAVDVVVFDGRGKTVMQTFDADPADANQASSRNAMAGQMTTTLETWSGLGARYAISIPEFKSETLPATGWRMVVLTEPTQFAEATDHLHSSLIQILAVVALVLLLISIGFIRIFLVPLHRMVMNAHELANGAEVLPLEDHRTAELSLLSSSLSRLQGRMLRAEDRVAELEAKQDEGVSGGRE